MRSHAIAALALAASGAAAQTPAIPGREALRRLAFLEGEWSGEAWAQTGPGPRHEFRQTESVHYSNSGHALIIQGTGWEPDGAGGERVVFNAVAIITHDPDSGYRMRSYVMEGRSGEYAVTPSDSGFVWGMDTGQGRVRYTMRLTPEGTWHEVGEFSRDGVTWRPVIELTVRKRN